MIIYIIRHAYAYEHGDPRWPDDSQRPLEPEGADRFAKAVKGLARVDFEPKAIASSPYVRCRQTADIVAHYSSGSPRVEELRALRPGSDLEALLDWTRRQNVETAAWVGHAPDVNRLASTLMSDGHAELRFSKGAIAAIRMHGELRPGGGELHWLATLKLLGA